MKRFVIIGMLLSLLCPLTFAQTLNIRTGNVTWQFPASQAGEMQFAGGTTLTVMGKTFSLSDVAQMYIDDSAVKDSTVSVVYAGTTASVTVAGNIAQFITVAQSGAHLSFTQRDDLAMEITYRLSGSSSNGEFYTSGSFKTTIELDNLTLTNAAPVYSGAALHVQNGKRINIKVLTGTTNTLRDASTGSQKGALYIKGHAEFKQYGTLNVYGNLKHAIKTGEYFSVKNATINILSAVGDGINCSQYFLMESGTVTISAAGDDGIQCDLDDPDAGSTGETTDHEGEDSGNVYIQGGTLRITCDDDGIKAAGQIVHTGGEVWVNGKQL